MITAKEALAAFKPRKSWLEGYLEGLETRVIEATEDGRTGIVADRFGLLSHDSQLEVIEALESRGYTLSPAVRHALIISWSDPK